MTEYDRTTRVHLAALDAEMDAYLAQRRRRGWTFGAILGAAMCLGVAWALRRGIR